MKKAEKEEETQTLLLKKASSAAASDPMEWIRGKALGKGSFATVNLAAFKPRFDPNNNPSVTPYLMAVKTTPITSSSLNNSTLHHEKKVLEHLQGCPEIITCFGNDQTVENGVVLDNLLLEYAENGSLADLLRLHPNGRFSVAEIRAFTGSILRGLCFIHGRGFAHCDIKLQNILSFANGQVKISDFGLSRRIHDDDDDEDEVHKKNGFVGTPMYMAPEAVTGSRIGSAAAADIWALGCAVVEMAGGKPPGWGCEELGALILRVGSGEEMPSIPAELGEIGMDFVEKCLVRDPNERWTAEMLMGHPFVSGPGLGEEEEGLTKIEDEESPRGPLDFDFLDWSPLLTPTEFRTDTAAIRLVGSSDVATAVAEEGGLCWKEVVVAEEEQLMVGSLELESGLKRIYELAGELVPDWSSDSTGWVTARCL